MQESLKTRYSLLFEQLSAMFSSDY